MRYLLFLFFILLFSCRSLKDQQTINENKTIEVIRDTFIVIKENVDTFYVNLHDVIKKDSFEIKNKNSSLLIKKHTENNFIVVCKEDEYKLKLDSVIRLKKVILKEKQIVKIEQCNNKIHFFSMYFSMITICFILLLMVIRRGV